MSIIQRKQINTTGSLYGTASWAQNVVNTIQYVNSNNANITSIQTQDYDTGVAVTFVDGNLKFIFGTPTVPAPTLQLSVFETNRFNKQLDAYNVIGTFNVGGYTLISASLYTGSVLLEKVGSGTSINIPLTTSGSQSYKLEVTSSNPIDDSQNKQSVTVNGTLNKTPPASPTITPTTNVQLGTTSNLIEQGATGSIAFSSASGADNNWVLNYVTSSYSTPITLLGSLTGSNDIIIAATSSYSSSGANGSDNDPARTIETYVTSTYTKIQSLRYGATTVASFTQSDLENLANWDTTLGGSVGTIEKGTYLKTTINNKVISISWTGDKYHYIIYDRGLGQLSQIKNAAGGNELSLGGKFYNNLTQTTDYNIYRSTVLLSSGGGSATAPYTLIFP